MVELNESVCRACHNEQQTRTMMIQLEVRHIQTHRLVHQKPPLSVSQRRHTLSSSAEKIACAWNRARGRSMSHDNVSGIARQIIDKFELSKQRLCAIMDYENICVKKNSNYSVGGPRAPLFPHISDRDISRYRQWNWNPKSAIWFIPFCWFNRNWRVVVVFKVFPAGNRVTRFLGMPDLLSIVLRQIESDKTRRWYQIPRQLVEKSSQMFTLTIVYLNVR
jgi:hypothetical protein